jgi:hypothetical protein
MMSVSTEIVPPCGHRTVRVNNYCFRNTTATGSPKRTAKTLADILEGGYARAFACQEPQLYFGT